MNQLDTAHAGHQLHTDAALDRKREATAQARAALAGIALHVTTADDGRREYIATRWSLTRSFGDIGELERWLDTVPGRPT